MKKVPTQIISFLLCVNVYAQNVGIGTNNPGSKLSAYGNLSIGTGYSTIAAPVNGAIIEGNVGIGNNAPAYKLDVNGTGNFSGQLRGTGGSNISGGNVDINLSSDHTANINSSIVTGNAVNINVNSLSTGTGLIISSNSTAGNGSKLLQIVRSGANSSSSAINYGLFSSISNTGTSSTNIAANLKASGGTTNVALRLEGATSGVVDISPAAVTTNYSLTLPATQASSAGLALVNDGAGNLSWADATAGSSFSISSQDNFEDFVFDDYAGSGSNDNQFAFTQAVVGSGASSEVDGGAVIAYAGGNDYAGIHVLNTGTTNSGRAAIGSFNHYNKLKVGGKQVAYEARVRIENLSTTAQTFTAYFGLMDLTLASGTVTTGAPVNGVYFTYTNTTALNTPNWMATCRSSSSSTSINSGVAVTANQWYKLRAIVNESGTNVDFYIDNTLIGSTATNIPTGAAMKFVFKLEKSAGTSARTCSIDYINWRMVR